MANCCCRKRALAAWTDSTVFVKRDVAKVHRDLAEWAEEAGRHFAGHSARVTGVMRMAFAGHAEWMIQVFGRWWSATVCNDVWEAVLDR